MKPGNPQALHERDLLTCKIACLWKRKLETNVYANTTGSQHPGAWFTQEALCGSMMTFTNHYKSLQMRVTHLHSHLNPDSRTNLTRTRGKSSSVPLTWGSQCSRLSSVILTEMRLQAHFTTASCSVVKAIFHPSPANPVPHRPLPTQATNLPLPNSTLSQDKCPCSQQSVPIVTRVSVFPFFYPSKMTKKPRVPCFLRTHKCWFRGHNPWTQLGLIS